MFAALKESVEWIVKLVTFDMTAEEFKVVRKFAFTVLWRVGVIAFVGIVIVRSNEYVRAADVDVKIAAAVKPLADNQTSMGHDVRLLTASMNVFLARSLATDIRLTYARMCAANRAKDWAEANRLREEYDQKQDDYRGRKGGKEYGPLSCSDP